jgi:hypothetical protein
MNRAALCLLVLAACKSGPSHHVPDKYAAMVPTQGLYFASERKADEKDPFNQGAGMDLIYDKFSADALHAAFGAKLAALDGYATYVDCALDGGFVLTALKAPKTAVAVAAYQTGDPTSWKVEMSVGDAAFIGIPDDPKCAWAPAAKPRCPDADDPYRCSLE